MIAHFLQFQFHYGSIISELQNTPLPEPSLFQFHYGSIIRKQIENNKSEFQ